MAVEWHRGPGGGDGSRRGFERGFLVATVVRYQDTHWRLGADGLRRPAGGAHWWAAFVVQERVEGRFETPEQAMAAAEAHHDRSSGG